MSPEDYNIAKTPYQELLKFKQNTWYYLLSPTPETEAAMTKREVENEYGKTYISITAKQKKAVEEFISTMTQNELDEEMELYGFEGKLDTLESCQQALLARWERNWIRRFLHPDNEEMAIVAQQLLVRAVQNKTVDYVQEFDLDQEKDYEDNITYKLKKEVRQVNLTNMDKVQVEDVLNWYALAEYEEVTNKHTMKKMILDFEYNAVTWWKQQREALGYNNQVFADDSEMDNPTGSDENNNDEEGSDDEEEDEDKDGEGMDKKEGGEEGGETEKQEGGKEHGKKANKNGTKPRGILPSMERGKAMKGSTKTPDKAAKKVNANAAGTGKKRTQNQDDGSGKTSKRARKENTGKGSAKKAASSANKAPSSANKARSSEKNAVEDESDGTGLEGNVDIVDGGGGKKRGRKENQPAGRTVEIPAKHKMPSFLQVRAYEKLREDTFVDGICVKPKEYRVGTNQYFYKHEEDSGTIGFDAKRDTSVFPGYGTGGGDYYKSTGIKPKLEELFGGTEELEKWENSQKYGKDELAPPGMEDWKSEKIARIKKQECHFLDPDKDNIFACVKCLNTLVDVPMPGVVPGAWHRHKCSDAAKQKDFHRMIKGYEEYNAMVRGKTAKKELEEAKEEMKKMNEEHDKKMTHKDDEIAQKDNEIAELKRKLAEATKKD